MECYADFKMIGGYEDSEDSSNGPDHMCANMNNKLFALLPLLSASKIVCCWCSLLKPSRDMDAGLFIAISISSTSVLQPPPFTLVHLLI